VEAAQSTPITVIEPQRGWHFPDLREAWAYRDLLYFLARRDVVVRYKQAIIGAFWAILQPVVIAGVFALFLGVIANLPPATSVPYPLFAVVGMVIWLPFTDAVSSASESTITSEALISKIWFPRVLIPLASIFPAIVDFFFGLAVAVVVALAYGYEPSLKIAAVPFALALAMTTALGIGLWFSALNVKYRDVHLLIPLVILTGLFISPILYPLSLVPAEWQWLYALNPMAGVLELFHWAILGPAAVPFPGLLLLIPICASVLLLITGSLYYDRAQRTFADII
jgi:lipopolysaccharide transport system permease protein